MKKIILLLILFCFNPIDASPSKVKALYNSLDPLSVAQHLAFYELYPDTQEGSVALMQALKLLSGTDSVANVDISRLPDYANAIDAIVRLVNKQPQEEIVLLDESA